MAFFRRLVFPAALAASAFGMAAAVQAQVGDAAKAVVPAKEEPQAQPEEPAAAALEIGGRAPALAFTSWVKGEPVGGFKTGQIYVVEFWATWCGPCKTSMPHLSELQTKYGDKVRMIGVSDEKDETVKKFLESDRVEGTTWDQTIKYSLAMDGEESTTAAYMRAAGENGIPTAFVVGKDGFIEWIGHPMGLDEPLAKIVGGSWDRVAARTERVEGKKQMLAMAAANQALRKAVRAEDWETALGIVDKLMAEYPKNPSMGFVRLSLLVQAERKDEAGKYVGTLVEKVWDDPIMLNQLSWGLATKDLPGSLDVAAKAAQRAVELTKEKEGGILDTLARVKFEQGKLDEAIEWQKKAVALDGANEEITEALKKYEAAKAAPKAPAP